MKLLWRSTLKFQNMYVGDYSERHPVALDIATYLHNIRQNYLYADICFRAGYKLEAAIEQLGVDVTDKIALDSGLSTGGFTDCLLQHGAAFVYGVDVGYGQVSM